MPRNEDVARLLCAAQPLIDLAIAEDIGPGDATGESTLDAQAQVTGRIVVKAHGTIAGLPVAEAVFRQVEPATQFVAYIADGALVCPGEVIAEVRGPARGLLAAERIALNFLGRLSGIATLASAFAQAISHTSAIVLDTRKTLPGYRWLDKYAVRQGGSQNHRLGLYDMILIKDNHIDSVGGITPAVEVARSTHPSLPVEVEVRSLDELREALSISPPLDRIMLDNMSEQEMRRAVALTAGRVKLEASGNITLDTAASVAETGVDYLSVGALTHSVRALDLSLEIGKAVEAQPTADVGARLADLKAALGRRVVILGHHYQRDEVITHADFRGDSLALARQATDTDAQTIVFCGVHFMAETAAILAKPGQQVTIPDPAAGCYLADTATPAAVQAAWDHLDAAYGDAAAVVTPLTYVNSSAELKAFCGRHGGIVCTSSNAEKALRWALQQRQRVFFFPDQHLGRNTAKLLGIPVEEMLLWQPTRVPDAQTLDRARVILWPGVCNVHQRFLPEHVRAVRARHPGIRVIAHPECRMEVVDLADDAGSTTHIIRQVEKAPPGTQWAIGTETRLVQRLQNEHPQQQIMSLAETPPICRTMSMITPDKLADVLEALVAGEIIHQVTVDQATAQWARVALERMLALG